MQTQNQTAEKPRREPKPLNGVDVPALFATIGAVRAQPELAQFTFRASSRWVKGTHSVARFETFTGAGGDHVHQFEAEYDADHPAPLCGADRGPTPVEYLLSALASCLTAGIGNIAAARGVELHEVTAKVAGEIDLRGLLGIDDSVRNGYSQLAIDFDIKGDGSEEQLRAIVEQSRARSAVYDVLTNGIPVAVSVNAQ